MQTKHHVRTRCSTSYLISHISYLKGKIANFTLIELLVVIAIIAILAGMLLPALSKARETARSSLCVSNQKNCALLLSQYADNNREFFPASLDKGTYGDKTGNIYWGAVLTALNYIKEPKQKSFNNIFFCPSVRGKGNYGWNTNGAYSYGLVRGNEAYGVLSSYTADPAYHFNRRSIMVRPEYRMIPLGGDTIHTRELYQSPALYVAAPGDTSSTRELGVGGYRVFHMRHNKRGNLFYADGHVGSASKKEITLDMTIKYANPTITCN